MFDMKLQKKYFDAIKYGHKKIEMRLNDEKRSKIQVGDTIIFSKEPLGNERIDTKVISLKKFDSFEEMVNYYDIKHLAPKGVTKEELINDLNKYYPLEKQNEYKCLAIEIEKQEKSCGIVVFNDDKVLLIKHNLGHFGLPKGHVEDNETEYETAIRETKEETNIDAKIIDGFRKVITYSPKENTMKDVVFFIGEAVSFDLIGQDSEVSLVNFYNFDEAVKLITHEDERNVLIDAIEYYKKG